MHRLEILKEKIGSIPEDGIRIPMQGGEFIAKPILKCGSLIGVNVSNLGEYPFLPLDVFVTVLSLLEISEQNRAKKGDAMNSKLGDAALGINTVEGLVAKVVYGKNLGDSVFRRITPISRILQWADICESRDGYLVFVS